MLGSEEGDRVSTAYHERDGAPYVRDMLAKGLNGEEVAERLVLSPETVRTHVRNAMEKLEANTRVGFPGAPCPVLRRRRAVG